jgi:hypothetical protein
MLLFEKFILNLISLVLLSCSLLKVVIGTVYYDNHFKIKPEKSNYYLIVVIACMINISPIFGQSRAKKKEIIADKDS